MTTTSGKPFLLVSTADERPEERALLAGLHSHTSRHALNWDIVPVSEGSSLGRQFLRRKYRAGACGVVIGRSRPVAADFPCDYFPWIEWVQPDCHLSGSVGIGMDAQAFTRVAVDHLIGQGARSLAITYAPPQGKNMVPEAIIDGFISAATTRSHTADILWRDEIRSKADRARYFNKMLVFFRQMPKPCGFFCVDDVSADWLISDLLYLGVSVPDDVLVLGGGGSLNAASARIPISTVRLPFHALGLMAAAQAHRLLCGQDPDQQFFTVAPMFVDQRASTAVASTGRDTILERAERCIDRRNEALPSVAQLAESCRCSRQYLLRYFRRVLARTPDDWLREQGLCRAAALLADTELPLQAIAERCGLSRASSLCTIFKKRYGQSPGAFRRQHQDRRPS